jgi:hypothetical protein
VRHHRWKDLLPLLHGRHAYRCRACRRRFYGANGSAESSEQLARALKNGDSHAGVKKRRSKRVRPWILQAAVFAVMLLLFLVFLRYMVREQPASETGRVHMGRTLRC